MISTLSAIHDLRAHKACGFFLMLLFGMSSACAGAHPSWLPPVEAQASGWRWTSQPPVQMQGARLQWYVLHADATPEQVARRLSDVSNGRLSRFLFAAEGIWLSGLVDGQHWLAQVAAEGAGTRALISALQAAETHFFDGASLLPEGARRLFSYSEPFASARCSVALYRLDAPTPSPLPAVLHRTLKSAQWRPENELSAVEGEARESRWIGVQGARLAVRMQHTGSAWLISLHHCPAERP